MNSTETSEESTAQGTRQMYRWVLLIALLIGAVFVWNIFRTASAPVVLVRVTNQDGEARNWTVPLDATEETRLLHFHEVAEWVFSDYEGQSIDADSAQPISLDFFYSVDMTGSYRELEGTRAANKLDTNATTSSEARYRLLVSMSNGDHLYTLEHSTGFPDDQTWHAMVIATGLDDFLEAVADEFNWQYDRIEAAAEALDSAVR